MEGEKDEQEEDEDKALDQHDDGSEEDDDDDEDPGRVDDKDDNGDGAGDLVDGGDAVQRALGHHASGVAALAGAEESTFENDGPLARYLANLVAYAKLRRDPANARYSADYLAKKAGLTHYGDNIGLTAKQKYAEDYTAVHHGRPRIFAPHVTIGKGLSPRTCLSIHFDWDPATQKLILARFGRHGRGA